MNSESQPAQLHEALQQPFGQLVQMLVQHAALALGQLPHPQSKQPEVNPPVARLMLDHLATLNDKTAGNLTEVEATLLSQACQSLEAQYRQLPNNHAAEARTPD